MQALVQLYSSPLPTEIHQSHAHLLRLEHHLRLFYRMLHSAALPDNFTFPFVLNKACFSLSTLPEALQIHGQHPNQSFGQGEWVHAYLSKNEKALQVFGNTSRKDVSTWDAMIDGLSSHGFEGL